jgi:hypothetical protein
MNIGLRVRLLWRYGTNPSQRFDHNSPMDLPSVCFHASVGCHASGPRLCRLPALRLILNGLRTMIIAKIQTGKMAEISRVFQEADQRDGTK